MQEAVRVRKSGVHHRELNSQELAHSLSLTDEDDGCLLRCASAQINGQTHIVENRQL
jgi:hypothetical protein